MIKSIHTVICMMLFLSIDINDTSRIVNVAQTKESSKHIVALIQSQSFVEQLVQWLGGLYTGYIPMVCHNEMDTGVC